MNRIILIVLIFNAFLTGYTQDYCGTPAYIKSLNKQQAGFEDAVNKTYKDALNYIKTASLRRGKQVINDVFEIPVVFHVLYNKSHENLPENVILDQLRIINEDFQRKNADTINLRNEFLNVAGNPRIKFVLAKKDPSGNITTGIVRRSTFVTEFGFRDLTDTDLAVKNTSFGGKNAWNPDKYLNIWVCNLAYAGLDFLLGYAYPPVNAAHWNSSIYQKNKNMEGVVLHYKACGSNNVYANSLPASKRYGRSLSHEIGHYLGLRHIWGDGNCSADDGIGDTPLASRKNSTCNKNANTCNEGSNDKKDLIENYMDYSPGNCQNTFTVQQVILMQYNLINLRPQLSEIEYKSVENTILYPNPVSDVINLSLKITVAAQYTMKMTDMFGRVVIKNSIENTPFHTINTVPFPNGLYVFQLFENGEEVFTEKIVIAH